MNIKYPVSGLALACALVLAACGGGEDVFPDVPVQVNLINVTKPGLTLKLNSEAPEPVDEKNNLFTFSKRVPANSSFKVDLGGSIPSNAISCAVENGDATVGITPLNTINVRCVLFTYKLGGTISGNLQSEMTINNGSGSVTVAAGAKTFALPPVPEGVPYSITILKQPTSGSCTVTPGTADGTIAAPIGTMPKAEVSNLNISCS